MWKDQFAPIFHKITICHFGLRTLPRHFLPSHFFLSFHRSSALAARSGHSEDPLLPLPNKTTPGQIQCRHRLISSFTRRLFSHHAQLHLSWCSLCRSKHLSRHAQLHLCVARSTPSHADSMTSATWSPLPRHAQLYLPHRDFCCSKTTPPTASSSISLSQIWPLTDAELECTMSLLLHNRSTPCYFGNGIRVRLVPQPLNL